MSPRWIYAPGGSRLSPGTTFVRVEFKTDDGAHVWLTYDSSAANYEKLHRDATTGVSPVSNLIGRSVRLSVRLEKKVGENAWFPKICGTQPVASAQPLTILPPAEIPVIPEARYRCPGHTIDERSPYFSSDKLYLCAGGWYCAHCIYGDPGNPRGPGESDPNAPGNGMTLAQRILEVREAYSNR